jgi:hypothetical protein
MTIVVMLSRLRASFLYARRIQFKPQTDKLLVRYQRLQVVRDWTLIESNKLYYFDQGLDICNKSRTIKLMLIYRL